MENLCCQVHVRFVLLRAVHDVYQSPWQPLHQLLPHGYDGTAARNSHVLSGGQVSVPRKFWRTTVLFQTVTIKKKKKVM